MRRAMAEIAVSFVTEWCVLNPAIGDAAG